MMARMTQVVVGLLLVAVVLIGVRSMVFGAERKAPLPAPVVDEHSTATRETAVFAGGCFWGVQAVFQRLKGVRDTTAGYSGGTADTATYSQVSTESTSHAEAVQV